MDAWMQSFPVCLSSPAVFTLVSATYVTHTAECCYRFKIVHISFKYYWSPTSLQAFLLPTGGFIHDIQSTLLLVFPYSLTQRQGFNCPHLSAIKIPGACHALSVESELVFRALFKLPVFVQISSYLQFCFALPPTAVAPFPNDSTIFFWTLELHTSLLNAEALIPHPFHKLSLRPIQKAWASLCNRICTLHSPTLRKRYTRA